MKKLTIIWSSRGLPVYGKVAIVKSQLISKLVYTSSLLPTPSYLIKKVNHIIYNFLWNGKGKVTRLSTIHNYESGGVKMIDIDSMIKALRLAWLKQIFSNNRATSKTYFMFLSKELGGRLIFSCNYDIEDLSITSLFYKELLQWWSQFRNDFVDKKDWCSVIWNNEEKNGKPVFYQTFFNFGIYCVSDLLINLSNIKSYNVINKKLKKVNVLTWFGRRYAIPLSLKKICGPTKGVTSFKHDGNVFDIMKHKSKDYYCLIISNKAQLPNNAHKLKQEFKLSEDDLELVYALPHTVALEPYVKPFQYKVLNSILCTNTKLYKIGYAEQDKCTFCNTEAEALHQSFFYCSHSNLLSKDCEQYAFSITKQDKVLNLQDITIIGSIDSSSCPLLNYLILINKLYLWDC